MGVVSGVFRLLFPRSSKFATLVATLGFIWCLSAEFLLLERWVEDSDLRLSSFLLGFLLALELLLDFAKLRLDLFRSLPRFCLDLCSWGSVSLRLELSFEVSEAAFAAETLLVI